MLMVWLCWIRGVFELACAQAFGGQICMARACGLIRLNAGNSPGPDIRRIDSLRAIS